MPLTIRTVSIVLCCLFAGSITATAKAPSAKAPAAAQVEPRAIQEERPEWAATLGAEIKRAQAAGDPDTGETYYRHWLNALERLVAEKGVMSRDNLARYAAAWDHAADRTPHGKPIELKAEDFT